MSKETYKRDQYPSKESYKRDLLMMALIPVCHKGDAVTAPHGAEVRQIQIRQKRPDAIKKDLQKRYTGYRVV